MWVYPRSIKQVMHRIHQRYTFLCRPHLGGVEVSNFKFRKQSYQVVWTIQCEGNATNKHATATFKLGRDLHNTHSSSPSAYQTSLEITTSGLPIFPSVLDLMPLKVNVTTSFRHSTTHGPRPCFKIPRVMLQRHLQRDPCVARIGVPIVEAVTCRSNIHPIAKTTAICFAELVPTSLCMSST